LDVQIKKGLLEACVLTVLKKKDSYGYQIIRDITSCIAISESTLYPILKRLEGGGYLTTYSLEHQGRLRKYYKITELGEQKIETFLQDWNEVMRVYRFIKEGYDE
jgi:PadR family transcriptional regulator PadR